MAEAEYERFAERRRAMLEAEGERARIEALEQAAKRLPDHLKVEGRKNSK
ncbi:MAG: hypothetical protein AMXMBFR84_20620 [Candidatus Hydrogenedentota bacterium]